MSTLAQLVTRVREKVDESTEAFWTDTVIENQINESYRFYWAFINKNHEGYFLGTSNISFDANSDGLYDLPSDFFSVRLVSRLLSTEKVPLRNQERYDSAVSNTISNATYNLPTYRLFGAQLKFEPAPDFSETNAVELEYTKILPNLSASEDVNAQVIALTEDCVVMRATIKCKAIEEMVAGGGVDADPFKLDLLTTEQILKELIEQRTVARRFVQQFGMYEDDAIQSWSI